MKKLSKITQEQTEKGAELIKAGFEAFEKYDFKNTKLVFLFQYTK